MTSQGARPSSGVSDDDAPGGGVPGGPLDPSPPEPPPAGYDLGKRLRIMGAILAGGVAAVLAVVLWLGVAVPAQQAAAGYSDADRVYAQVMAEHNAQAIELASLAPRRSENPGVLKLAREVGEASAEQADALAVWMADRRIPVPASVTAALALVENGGLDGAGDDGGSGSGPRAPAGLQHVHGTNTEHGMLAPEQIDRMAGLEGEEFDAALIGALVEHHYGGLQPVDEQVAGGTDPDATGLAEVERDRIRAEITSLRRTLGSL